MAKRKAATSNGKRDRWATFDMAEMARVRGELTEISREVSGFVDAAERAGFDGSLRVDGGAAVYDALRDLVAWLRRSQEMYDSQRIGRK